MTQTLTMVKALNAGLRRALAADPTVVLSGEDIGKLGGVFRVTEGLQAEFGADRVIDTPLAESGIVGTAIGMAVRGYRPVVEIQFDGFVFPAFDQLVTQAARLFHRTHGRINVPLVLRLPYGGGIGSVEHHSDSPEAYFAHTPGLKVVAAATPSDAYWMIQQAIASPDPVIFLEPTRRYHEKGEVDTEATPLPLHQARVVKQGRDLTVLAYGTMVRPCVEAAIVAADEGRDLEVIDLRSISPLDDDTILTSVAKTGRAVVVHEAHRTLGVGAEIAARIQERCFYALQAPVLRVTGYDMPFPPSRAESEYLPDLDRVLDAVDRSLAF
ncbi:MAG: alpha-ketoacid dehydrogenase subunit beta [Propionicimonas sp.]|nr:alpha-ketoacid dehydrogenase subunit beta [Propionicimonas sp.]